MYYRTDKALVGGFVDDVLRYGGGRRTTKLRRIRRAFRLWKKEKCHAEQRDLPVGRLQLLLCNHFQAAEGPIRRFYCVLQTSWDERVPKVLSNAPRKNWKSMTLEERQESRARNYQREVDRARRMTLRALKKQHFVEQESLELKALRELFVEDEVRKRQLSVLPSRSRYLKRLLR